MGNAATETAEAKAKREAEEKARDEQKRALEQQARDSAKPEEQGIMGLIMGFIKWFIGLFIPSTNAPEETPPAAPGTPAPPPETLGDRVRMGKLLIESRAIPKWQEYMQTHKGEKVAFVSPLEGNSVVESNYGMRYHPIHKKDMMHDGIDLVAPHRNVVASAGGIILFSGNKQGYGQTVIIGHADGSSTLSGHLTGQAMPAVGSEVAQRQQIGVLGATGDVTGAHLHYEQRRGEQSVQPVINGVEVKKGMQVAGAGSAAPHAFAALVDPNKLPKLPAQNGGKPQALAFAGVHSTGAGHAHVH